MSDTEALNLIEHYGWSIIVVDRLTENVRFCVNGDFGKTKTFKTVREAIVGALAAQANWSVG